VRRKNIPSIVRVCSLYQSDTEWIIKGSRLCNENLWPLIAVDFLLQRTESKRSEWIIKGSRLCNESPWPLIAVFFSRCHPCKRDSEYVHSFKEYDTPSSYSFLLKSMTPHRHILLKIMTPHRHKLYSMNEPTVFTASFPLLLISAEACGSCPFSGNQSLS